jgi:acetolactate synthase-1/2/3 large subunit
MAGGIAMTMNGAESLVRTMVAGGVDVCFTNPGTSEMHFVAALDRVDGMRCVLCLFEGVTSGAADGYARMADKPASTLLHLGPGLGNALANLHNLKKAKSPVVNIVGEHATYHRRFDAPLTSDIEGIARPVSHWVRTSMSAHDVAGDGAAAIASARVPPGQVATLILPADTAWNEGTGIAEIPPIAARTPVESAAIQRAAEALRGGQATMLIGGVALREAGQRAAARIAAATGCRVLAEGSNARVQRGRGRLPLERVPYPVDQALATFKDTRAIVLCGAKEPTAFFAYPGKPSLFAPDGCAIIPLALPHEDLVGALEALAETLKAPAAAVMPDAPRPAMPRGALTPETIADALCHLIPDNAIVVDESVTTGRGFFRATHGAAPHDWLALTGGAIGEGLCLSTGAAVACPDRQVIGLQADGSAMYTVQALWTHARENLKILTLIWSNRAYAILRHELMNVGANPGRKALDMLSLGDPDIDWVGMARSMGVPGSRVESIEGLAKAVQAGLAAQGPYLVEVVL